MRKARSLVVSEMRAEYDFTGGVRGKYVGRVRGGGKVVILEPDVAKVFPDSRSANRALRAIAGVIQRVTKKSR